MKTNSFKSRRLSVWSACALLAALSLLPCPPGVMAAGFRAPQEKVPEKNQLEFTFQGKVEAVDLTAQTFKVDGKVYTVTRDSKIMKDTKPAKLMDISAGDMASGMARQGFNGKYEAMTVTVTARKP
jgi:hypothetical protein